jgi:hypothetical protein
VSNGGDADGFGEFAEGVFGALVKNLPFPAEEAPASPASLPASQCLMGISRFLFYSPPLRLPLARVLFHVQTTAFYFSIKV